MRLCFIYTIGTANALYSILLECCSVICIETIDIRITPLAVRGPSYVALLDGRWLVTLVETRTRKAKWSIFGECHFTKLNWQYVWTIATALPLRFNSATIFWFYYNPHIHRHPRNASDRNNVTIILLSTSAYQRNILMNCGLLFAVRKKQLPIKGTLSSAHSLWWLPNYSTMTIRT